jgi:hypothetical protein
MIEQEIDIIMGNSSTIRKVTAIELCRVFL